MRLETIFSITALLVPKGIRYLSIPTALGLSVEAKFKMHLIPEKLKERVIPILLVVFLAPTCGIPDTEM